MRWVLPIVLTAACGRIGFDARGDANGSGDGAIDAPPMSLCPARDVDVGRGHACMADQVGNVWCWGYNEKGQADPTTTDLYAPTPRRIVLSGPATNIAVGRFVSCALLENGTASCWGYNAEGERGDNNLPGRGPTQVALPGLVDDLGLGARTGCARLASDQSLVCWGASQDGELGAATPSPIPIAIASTGGTQQLSMGHRHNCVVDPGGGLVCWGRSGSGQQAGAPQGFALNTIGGFAGVVQVAASSRATCVVDTAGSVRCMGSNQHGQLGNGVTPNNPNPVLVPVDDAVEVAIGIQGACARRRDGSVTCWGRGPKATGTFDSGMTPRPALLANVSKLAMGYSHSCAIANGGDVVCWGPNEDGELGRGTRSITTVPVLVDLGGATADQFSVGGRHACVRSGAKVLCWGYNVGGQIGDGTTTQRAVAIEIATGLGAPVQIATGEQASCAWSGSTLKCWGNNSSRQLVDSGNALELLPVTTNFTGTIQQVALGGTHTCVIADSAVSCEGANLAGQLGNGTNADSPTPVNVTLPQTPTLIAAGEVHTCALAGPDVFCWGENFDGRLGDGTTMDRNTPVLAPIGGQTVVEISLGAGHSCARTSAGAIYCWGENDYGQLGVGNYTPRSSPTLVTLPAPAIDVSAGGNFTCALLNNTETYCWGNGRHGQLADPSLIGASLPNLAPSLASITALGAGGAGGCAMRVDGLACWGERVLVPDGDASTMTPLPVLVPCP